MSRDEALKRLRASEAVLRGHGAGALYLFGSTARDEASANSDVDVLVDAADESSFDLFDLIAVRDAIADLLTSKVDIIEGSARQTPFRDLIRPDLLKVF